MKTQTKVKIGAPISYHIINFIQVKNPGKNFKITNEVSLHHQPL